jgi:hypothetical protein
VSGPSVKVAAGQGMVAGDQVSQIYGQILEQGSL